MEAFWAVVLAISFGGLAISLVWPYLGGEPYDPHNDDDDLAL